MENEVYQINNVILLFFLVVFVLSFLLYPIIYQFFTHVGKSEESTANRWSQQTKPTVGGIVFFLSFLISMMLAFIICDNTQFFYSLAFGGFLLGAFLSFITGLIDDTKRLLPYQKFILQSFIAFIVILTGNDIHFFNRYELDAILTYIWFVGLMNSINFLDNMDGMATTLSIGIITAIITISIFSPSYDPPLYLLLMMGVIAFLLAFLYFNWPPSKFYMGDNGSMLLGFLLAYLGVKFIWNNVSFHQLTPFQHLTMVWLIYLWPITDTALVTVERLSLGKKPWQGGKDHTNHHLVFLGLKEKHVLFTTMAIMLLINLIVFLFFQSNTWNIFLWLGILSFIGAFTLFFAIIIFLINKPQQ